MLTWNLCTCLAVAKLGTKLCWAVGALLKPRTSGRFQGEVVSLQCSTRLLLSRELQDFHVRWLELHTYRLGHREAPGSSPLQPSTGPPNKDSLHNSSSPALTGFSSVTSALLDHPLDYRNDFSYS